MLDHPIQFKFCASKKSVSKNVAKPKHKFSITPKTKPML